MNPLNYNYVKVQTAYGIEKVRLWHRFDDAGSVDPFTRLDEKCPMCGENAVVIDNIFDDKHFRCRCERCNFTTDFDKSPNHAYAKFLLICDALYEHMNRPKKKRGITAKYIPVGGDKADEGNE